jgi:hypothetical protein
MRRGCQIDHKRGGAKILDHGLMGLRAHGQHSFLKLSDG